MILSIDSSMETFKRVEFREGLNVVLSDSQPEATQKQTRNSAGKTSLVEIIHFLLGADCNPDSLFRTVELVEHSFLAEFEFRGLLLKVARSGSTPARIFFLHGFEGMDDLPIKHEKGSGTPYLSNTNWKMFLGHLLFGLPSDLNGSIFDQPYTPSFRSMVSYFARRHNSGGFISPERQAEKQQVWDWQENLSYLFGLDWLIPFEFRKIKERENALKELKKAAKSGAFGSAIGTVAELRSQVTVAEKKTIERKTQLQNFKVADAYSELSLKAAQAKSEIQALSRTSVVLNETLNHLQAALLSELPAEPFVLEKMYTAVGIELPGVARKRLDEVSAFYQSVVQNRESHLRTEIDQYIEQIKNNSNVIETYDQERQEILKTLESHGALEDFLDLQKELAELEANLASLRERHKSAELLEGEKTQLDIDRGNMQRRLQEDFKERKGILNEAIILVTDAISELYSDRNGRFEISATNTGPEFKVSIEGDRGGGIAKIENFCFDLALLQLNSSKSLGPDFLMHDSHLYDGVDERQIASALLLGASATEGNGLQYIVTMNSDIFDRLPLDETIDRNQVILGTRLSDETDAGGLFGFQFD